MDDEPAPANDDAPVPADDPAPSFENEWDEAGAHNNLTVTKDEKNNGTTTAVLAQSASTNATKHDQHSLNGTKQVNVTSDLQVNATKHVAADVGKK